MMIQSKISVLIGLLCCSASLFAQPEVYRQHIAQAEQAYLSGDYAASARHYSDAFASFGWKGYTEDRYRAARAWAQMGVPDSAFFNLFRIAEKTGFSDLEALRTEPAFASLRQLPRWPELYQRVKDNQPAFPDLAKELEVILVEDQRYRKLMDSVQEKYGWQSPQMQALFEQMSRVDSANTVRASQILDAYGWLGEKEVGARGNQALFLVVQHADIETQEKYLPLMRQAVQHGKARGADLALLEDRVRMRNGQKQLYGSQLRTDPITNETYFFPIEDVEKVDERRAAVGLQPLAEYARHFGIEWNQAALEDNKKREVPPAEPRRRH